MYTQKSTYQSLSQQEQDSILLQIVAVLSAIFCLSIFSIAAYILIHKTAPFEAIILLFYVAMLFAGFSYAALCMQKDSEKSIPIVKSLSENSVGYDEIPNFCFIQPNILDQSQSNAKLFCLIKPIRLKRSHVL